MKKAEIAHNRRVRTLHLIKAQFKGNKTKFAHALSENSGKHIAVTIVHRWFWNNHQRRNIGESHARLIEDAFDLEYAWLDGFTNATLQSDEQINEPKADYIVKKSKPATLAPVISWEQIDDFKNLNTDEVTEWIANPTENSNAYYLRVTGEAMHSQESVTFSKGMLILVEPTIEAVTDDFVIAKLDSQNSLIFRQLKQDESGKSYLKPLNASFPIAFDEFNIVGKIVFSGMFFN